MSLIKGIHHVCIKSESEMEYEKVVKFYGSVLGKPTCQKGEPKTDIYILTQSSLDKREIKISYKKELEFLLYIIRVLIISSLIQRNDKYRFSGTYIL